MFVPQYWTPAYWTNKFWAWARSGHTVMCLDAGYDVFTMKASVKQFTFDASVQGPMKFKARKSAPIELPASLDD
jgi:hypothetical protein